MIFSRRLVLVLCLSLMPALFAADVRKAPTRPAAAPAAYKAAVVMDAATGNVLFEENADHIGPPASMTKLMTFAVLHDLLGKGSLTLATPVKIQNEDNIGGTQVYLDPRETFPVEELIYAMMVQSANDAARALARFSAGSVPAFVELMNAKARELGMKNTTFRTPHGLPPSNRRIADGDLTTPRDFALLSRYLVEHTNVLKYASIARRDFAPERAKGPFKMDNHNNLLGKVAGVDGLKTGFTNGAGYCISATAQRNGRRVIVVTMGSPTAVTRDLRVTELLERGFAALPPAPAAATPPTPAAAATPSDSLLSPAPVNAAPPRPAEPSIKLSLPQRK